MTWLVIFLLFVVILPITNGLNPRTLDEGENKCGGCPCGNPCNPPASYSPPPPPPALPPPPPPSPPPPKKPPSSYCPPPPSGGGSGGGGGGGGGGYSPYPPNSQYLYMTGPPGSLYPVDHDFSGTAKRSGFSVLLMGGLFLFGLLSFW